MNILVTGATGFLGGRIVQHLVASGHHVTLATRDKAQLPLWANGAAQQTLDWQDQLSIVHCCSGQDIVIHAAGMNAQDCAADPSAAIEFNGAATARLADIAAKAGVKKFFFLSTAHVYGAPLAGEVTEETCTKNNHPYAFSKRAGESAVLYNHLRMDMQTVVLRLTNIIGAPAHAGVNAWMLLVNDICRQAVANHKIVLHTHGRQLRDFLGMQAFLATLNDMLAMDFTDYKVPIFNIGSARSIMVLEMAGMVKERCELLFSTPVALQLPQEANTKNLPQEKLLFSTERIHDAGVFHLSDLEQEIDELLWFCKNKINGY